MRYDSSIPSTAIETSPMGIQFVEKGAAPGLLDNGTESCRKSVFPRPHATASKKRWRSMDCPEMDDLNSRAISTAACVCTVADTTTNGSLGAPSGPTKDLDCLVLPLFQ